MRFVKHVQVDHLQFSVYGLYHTFTNGYKQTRHICCKLTWRLLLKHPQLHVILPLKCILAPVAISLVRLFVCWLLCLVNESVIY
jgi:hypothetical protein